MGTVEIVFDQATYQTGDNISGVLTLPADVYAILAEDGFDFVLERVIIQPNREDSVVTVLDYRVAAPDVMIKMPFNIGTAYGLMHDSFTCPSVQLRYYLKVVSIDGLSSYDPIELMVQNFLIEPPQSWRSHGVSMLCVFDDSYIDVQFPRNIFTLDGLIEGVVEARIHDRLIDSVGVELIRKVYVRGGRCVETVTVGEFDLSHLEWQLGEDSLVEFSMLAPPGMPVSLEVPGHFWVVYMVVLTVWHYEKVLRQRYDPEWEYGGDSNYSEDDVASLEEHKKVATATLKFYRRV